MQTDSGSGGGPAELGYRGRPRFVIAGAGFAGFHCARRLDRNVASSAEEVLVNRGDHTISSSLLSDVVGGV